MEVSFPTDSDGFISQECPSCEHRFKVVFGEGSEEPISCCPYCGHRGEDCWHTSEQVEYLEAVAMAEVVAPELKKLTRSLQGGLISFDIASSIPQPSSPPMETDDDFETLSFQCCDETVKVARQDRHFCIICGTEVNMEASEATKVFLSHKGVDKDEVKDYMQTLLVLGYEPWLDEDAMPAGTPLERGLLRGMQDSCGVVFFITPSFKDEGYLETEIDYAVEEKRKKGDKFAIITLQFMDDRGEVGEIPDLLKRYVWKTPKTPLEALREVLRALPVISGSIQWRPEITDVATVSGIKSTTAALSDEAKAILLAAESGDGRIMHTRTSGGDNLSAGKQSMIPNQEGRTVALWVGGLEDLRRRRFVKDLGHKGEVFELTREGYEAADQLRKST